MRVQKGRKELCTGTNPKGVVSQCARILVPWGDEGPEVFHWIGERLGRENREPGRGVHSGQTPSRFRPRSCLYRGSAWRAW
jgi:hypothetical protein